MFEANLIALYSYVCERYEADLKYCCQRFSNNNRPLFTDQEAITIYLYAVRYEQRFKIKDIYGFTRRYLMSWFPLLPSYQAFNHRINRLCTVFQKLTATLLEEHIPQHCEPDQALTDSLPVITCSGKRKGKVATAITSKGYCATKGMYYYGLKIHLSGLRRKGTMPFPGYLAVSGAEENDLAVFKENDYGYGEGQFYGDKAYCDKPYFGSLSEHQGVEMLTPVKLVKGEVEQVRQFNKAADELVSRAVSAVRQPIESLFNWLIERTDIQRASKVRSTAGLLVHVFGKIAAAFSDLIFNP